MERLQKFLASAGIASRRNAEELIRQNRVQVNGVLAQLGSNVDPVRDQITLDGRPITKELPVYLLLFKPKGVITSRHDPQGRKTVMDLLPATFSAVHPVGRLDYDTAGLLLLTNDGNWTNLLTHPRHQVTKTYHAEVEGFPSAKVLKRLREGVLLEDGWTAPAIVELVKKGPSTSFIELTIREGRNRQVRRMCAKIHHPVVTLTRVKVGFLTLEHLRPGEYRHLHPTEVAGMAQLAKGESQRV